MHTSPAPAVARAAAAVVGVALVGLSGALVAGGTRGAAYDTTYGDVSASFALLEVVVGAALLVAALLLLADRTTATLGTLAVAASAAWFAPVWVGWDGGPALVRSVGLVAAPLLPALVLAVAAWIPPRTPARFVLAPAGILATAGASVALALVRDPLRDRYCWSDCTANAFLVHDDVRLARRFTWLVLGLAAATGVLAALVAATRLLRATPVIRRGSGPALAAASLAGLALAAYALSLHYDPQEVPDRPLYEGLFAARAGPLLALATALVWLALRPRLVRGLVTRLAVDLERSTAEGGLGPLLARALGDPELRLGYPIGPDARVVDAEGLPVVLRESRRVTPIVGDEGVVALVESDAARIDELERELGPAAHLALGNERLRAEALARLADVSASRARIVETADAARLRMERDLHDGAQQRMLALTYDLRVALATAESAGNERAAAPLRSALETTLAAAEELRDVAHGIFPAELAASGLEAALKSLADVRPLRLTVELPAGRRYRPDVETAAYAVVVEAVDAGDATVVAAVSEAGGSLCLALDGAALSHERLVHVEDRILAAGGSVAVADGRLDVVLPHT